jgi:hypothetical protein
MAEVSILSFRESTTQLATTMSSDNSIVDRPMVEMLTRRLSVPVTLVIIHIQDKLSAKETKPPTIIFFMSTEYLSPSASKRQAPLSDAPTNIC